MIKVQLDPKGNAMFRILAVLISLCIFVSVGTSSATARERIALLVGNGDYQSVSSLPNPTNDAEGMAEALAGLGFKVTTVLDANQQTMRKAINRFGAELKATGPDVVGFFFYAGHAVQLQGGNYLIPTDASVTDEAQLSQQGVHLQEIARQMKDAQISVSFMVIDACRDNPFEAEFFIPSGLAQIRAPRGSIVAYSTEPGAVALDGDGRHSPYTAALIEEISKPGVPVEQMFKRVRRRLLDVTAFQQISWESSSLTEDLFFVSQSRGTSASGAFPDTRERHSVDWGSYDWQDLTVEQQKQWSILGWTAASWNGDGPEPKSEVAIWDNLAATEQHAAVALGYTKHMWDGTEGSFQGAVIAQEKPQVVASETAVPPQVDWDQYDWADMSPAQQTLWSQLGWSAASWSGSEPGPATENLGWGELTTAQRNAATALGFTKSEWDGTP